jgi:hypothetical protein
MEEMIKRRVKEGNFSDVLPPPPQKDGDAGHSGACLSSVPMPKCDLISKYLALLNVLSQMSKSCHRRRTSWVSAR